MSANGRLATSGKLFSVMVLLVFGDESADETKQRVFAISGLFGTEEEWQEAEAEWTKATHGEVFHAADWEHAKRFDEYRIMVEVLAASPVGGVAYSLDLSAYRQTFPDTLPETPYHKCFSRLVKDTANTAVAFNDARSLGQPRISKLEFTFDNRPEVEFSAARLYDSHINEPKWSASPLLASKISFESRTNPRIQMADMIARECMKDLDRIVGPVKFTERRSKIVLVNSGKFRFFPLSKDDFESERLSFVEFEEKDGFGEAAYYQWLSERGAQDTWDNRARFHSVFDKWRKK
jgi:hypothetical protein